MVKRKGSKISIEGKEAKIKRIDLPSGSARLCVFCVPCRSAEGGRVGYISLFGSDMRSKPLRISQPAS